MGFTTIEGLSDSDTGVYRTSSRGLVMFDRLGKVFDDSENPAVRKEYFKSPLSEFYETFRNYVSKVFSKFEKQKDISSRV